MARANQGGQEIIVSSTNTSGAMTLNPSLGNVFLLTLTGNATIGFSSIASGRACSITLHLTQDAVGARTVTWQNNILWAGGVRPTLSTTSGAVDILVFESVNNGATFCYRHRLSKTSKINWFSLLGENDTWRATTRDEGGCSRVNPRRTIAHNGA